MKCGFANLRTIFQRRKYASVFFQWWEKARQKKQKQDSPNTIAIGSRTASSKFHMGIKLSFHIPHPPVISGGKSARRLPSRKSNPQVKQPVSLVDSALPVLYRHQGPASVIGQEVDSTPCLKAGNSTSWHAEHLPFLIHLDLATSQNLQVVAFNMNLCHVSNHISENAWVIKIPLFLVSDAKVRVNCAGLLRTWKYFSKKDVEDWKMKSESKNPSPWSPLC